MTLRRGWLSHPMSGGPIRTGPAEAVAGARSGRASGYPSARRPASTAPAAIVRANARECAPLRYYSGTTGAAPDSLGFVRQSRATACVLHFGHETRDSCDKAGQQLASYTSGMRLDVVRELDARQRRLERSLDAVLRHAQARYQRARDEYRRLSLVDPLAIAPRRLTTVGKVAARYGVSDRTIQRRIDDGTLTDFREVKKRGVPCVLDADEADRVLPDLLR